MAKPKYDGVVDSVHFKPGGEVAWVRAYERRGSTFSDHVLIDRDTLIQKLKSGKKYVVGRRVPLMASTFEVDQPLKVVRSGDQDVLAVGDTQADRDRLDDVPVI
ncbi:MAG: hypothetical protein JSV61_16575 [Anaerolineales bacterium]|nr:MAG: hypothetical protein JSV61_16575 [Anaerolineales bacterium]